MCLPMEASGDFCYIHYKQLRSITDVNYQCQLHSITINYQQLQSITVNYNQLQLIGSIIFNYCQLPSITVHYIQLRSYVNVHMHMHMIMHMHMHLHMDGNRPESLVLLMT